MTTGSDRAGHSAAAVAWAEQQLPGGEPRCFRTRPWAQVWSVAAPSARWWLKINSAATGYEPRVLQLLADLGTPLSPEVRVHPSRPWALVVDAGRPLHEVVERVADLRATVDFWCVLLARYAELQQALPPERVRAAGVPDASPAALPGLLAELLSEPGWLAPANAPDLDDRDRQRIRSCGPLLSAAAAELADGLPPMIQHDDLHDANVFCPDAELDPQRATIIDWGDASLSHPFGTLLVTLRTLAASQSLPAGNAQLARVRAAYLEVWRTRGESAAELDRQLDLALRTGPLVRAAGWRRALGAPGAGRELGMSDATAHWLRGLADGLAVG